MKLAAAALLQIILVIFSSIPANASSDPLVCTYFYVWYSSEGRHWGQPGDPYWSIIDTPVKGLYESRSIEIQRWQLQHIKQAGINCIFVSWWGPSSFEDEAARKVFWLADEYSLKAAILVEPYLGEDPSIYDASWWSQTLSYIKENFIDKYPESYLYLDAKPLVLGFNPIGLNYDPRPDFTQYSIRIVGNDIDNAGYQDWDLWPDYDSSLTGELRLRRDGYVALAPRFDDEHFRPGGVPPYDPNLTEGWYEKQWQWVLEHRDEVRIIAIYSWNEYHERSQIEPYNDATANVEPYYLYNITKKYTSELELRNVGRVISTELALGLIAILVISAVISTIMIIKRT